MYDTIVLETTKTAAPLVGRGDGRDSMESTRGLQQSALTPGAITVRVVLNAKRAFSTGRNEERIERVARQAVEEFWSNKVKVTTFIPVLAIRRVRDLLEQQSDDHSTTGAR
jgi:hypothetical protein